MSILLIWCAFFATYLLFAGQISWHEVVTGIVLASLTTVWPQVVRRTSRRCFSFLPQFLRPMARGLGQLVSGTLTTGAVLVRVAFFGVDAGRARANDFDDGVRESRGLPTALFNPAIVTWLARFYLAWAGHWYWSGWLHLMGRDWRIQRAPDGESRQSVDRARRAVAVLLASCAPDRFVVNVDRRSEKVLIHTLVPSERELDPQWLI